MDNSQNVGDNMWLGMDNSKLKKIIQTIYGCDPTTNYVGGLVL